MVRRWPAPRKALGRDTVPRPSSNGQRGATAGAGTGWRPWAGYARGMKIEKNYHVLAVPDATASARFFIDVLGFEPVPVDDDGWRFVQRDQLWIMLGSCPDALAPLELGDHSYFAYWVVDDVDAFYARARGHALAAPSDMPWGMREFPLRTPDGHRLMIAQRL